MDSEIVLLEINFEIIIYKQTDVSDECADKDGEINIFDSIVIINNYTPDYTSF